MVFDRVRDIAPGTIMPTPKEANHRVKGPGIRREEEAIIYTIPSRTNPGKVYEKGITASEIERAHEQLISSGVFTRAWFEENLPRCNAEGGCNFTALGGLFVWLRTAEYAGQGSYRRRPAATSR